MTSTWPWKYVEMGDENLLAVAIFTSKGWRLVFDSPLHPCLPCSLWLKCTNYRAFQGAQQGWFCIEGRSQFHSAWPHLPLLVCSSNNNAAIDEVCLSFLHTYDMATDQSAHTFMFCFDMFRFTIPNINTVTQAPIWTRIWRQRIAQMAGTTAWL